jgi:helix-turn-helix protein
MKPNWKTEDVQVAASITATVTIALTADLQIHQNLIRNLSLSQKLRTSSETENQQINFFYF